MNAVPPPVPRRVAIAPFDCLARAGRLVQGDYWTLVAITLVGVLLAAIVPLQLLAAPMYAGMFMAFKSREQGRPTAFEQLFSRFDTFLQGMIATLVYLVAVIVVSLPVYGVILGSAVGGSAAMDEHHEALGVALFCVTGLGYAAALALALVAQTVFTFTYALIAEHELEGLDALRLSVRATWMNLWGVLGLVLVIGLAMALGSLCCFVPLVFVLPHLVGAQWVAFRKVFGGGPPAEVAPALADAG